MCCEGNEASTACLAGLPRALLSAPESTVHAMPDRCDSWDCCMRIALAHSVGTLPVLKAAGWLRLTYIVRKWSNCNSRLDCSSADSSSCRSLLDELILPGAFRCGRSALRRIRLLKFLFTDSSTCRPLLDELTLPGVSRCGLNVPCPDRVTPMRVASSIWSWAEGHPASLPAMNGTSRPTQRQSPAAAVIEAGSSSSSSRGPMEAVQWVAGGLRHLWQRVWPSAATPPLLQDAVGPPCSTRQFDGDLASQSTCITADGSSNLLACTRAKQSNNMLVCGDLHKKTLWAALRL